MNIISKHMAVPMAVIALLAGSVASHAVLINIPVGTPSNTIGVPGGDFSNQPLDFPGPGSVVAIYNFGPVTSPGVFTFQGTEVVWKDDATGNLSLLFQVENLAGSPESIKRVTVNGGFSPSIITDVGYDARGAFTAGVLAVGDTGDPLKGMDPGTAIPLFADRTASSTVGFNFPSMGNDIDAGTKSKWFVISTNAQLPLGPGTINVIDGGVAFTNVLVPVPEPASVLFGIALSGVVASGRMRRFRKDSVVG